MSLLKRLTDWWQRGATPEELLEGLQTLSQGLVYTSETDANYEIVNWSEFNDQPLDANFLLEFLNFESGTPVITMTTQHFFEPMFQVRPYHSSQKRQEIAQYEALALFIQQKMPKATVFKIGDIEQYIFILTKLENGSVIGLKTFGVET